MKHEEYMTSNRIRKVSRYLDNYFLGKIDEKTVKRFLDELQIRGEFVSNKPINTHLCDHDGFIGFDYHGQKWLEANFDHEKQRQTFGIPKGEH